MSTQLDPPRTALAERTVRVNVDDEPEKTVVVNRFGRDETVLDVPRRAESRPRESEEWSLGRALSFGGGEPYSQLTDVGEPETPAAAPSTAP